MVKKKYYDGYVRSLINASRLTNKENSVLINFDFIDDRCINIVEFVQQDGTKDTLKNETFACDDEFYRLLEKFVVEYYKNMVIAFDDNIDMMSEGKYTYRVVTEDNDMMCINNITLQYANYLRDLVANRDNFDDKEEIVEEVTIEDEKGNITFITTLFLFVAIFLSFIIMTLLLS